jgi:hypothetical protein
MGGLTGKEHAPQPETSLSSDGLVREEEKTHSTVLIEEKQNRMAELVVGLCAGFAVQQGQAFNSGSDYHHAYTSGGKVLGS